MSRALSVLAAVVLASLLGSSGVAFGGSGNDSVIIRDGRTQPAFSYESAVRETVYVQSTVDADGDGERDLIATDIVRPRETESGDLKVPVIYENSPYYQFLGRGNESETKEPEDGDFRPERFPLFYDNYFVPRGYAVVLQDMTGTRNSEGCMELGGKGEVAAARATVDWLNGRARAFTASGEEVRAEWSTGKVGMIGKSYDGTIANATAATGVEGLETIVPIGAISRWYDYHLNNGVQYLNAYLTPGLFTFAIDQTPADDEERRRQWVEATFGENSFCQAKGTEIVARAADPRADYTAFWYERDYLKDAEKVRASVFLVHGRNDFNVKPNHYVQWWKALKRHDVPRKIWLGQTGHVDPFDFRRDEWVETLHHWFDHWLYGVDNGIMAEPVADVEREADEWRRYPSWPADDAQSARLNLGPGEGRRPGVLTTGPVSPDASQSYTDAPEQGEGEMVSEEFRKKENRLIFLSPELRHSVRISGEIPISIKATVNRFDTNFTALLVDYGESQRVHHESAGEGVRTTSDQSCHGQSTAKDDACYFETEKTTHVAPYEIVSRGWLDARHRESLQEGSPLTPGQSYRFRWEIFGEDYIFEKGHRIGVVIAGSDADYTVSDTSAATVDVELDESYVELPVVGGQRDLGF